MNSILCISSQFLCHRRRLLWLSVLIGFTFTANAQTPIICGQTVARTTTSPAQTDVYSYTGSAGQVLALRLSGPINCGSPARFMVADVYSPSGQLLSTFQALCDGGRGTSLPLPNTGTYTILVHEANYNATGSYSLSAQLVTAGGCGKPIGCGQTVGTNSTYAGQLDAYSYTGSAGQVLALGLSGPIGCGSPVRFMVADVYNPSGQLWTTIQALCDGGGGTSLPLTNTGAYTILVHEANYRATGSYSLSAQSVTAGGCGRPIACGQTVGTNTTYSGQSDAYSYTGSAGQVLALGLWGPISCGSPARFMAADVYSPSGQLLTTLQALCNGGGGGSLPLPSTGNYTILVHEANYRAIGSYKLSVQSRGECSPPLLCGQSANSQISLASEVDGLSLTAAAGATAVLNFGGFSGVQFDFYDPTGNIVFTKYSGSSTNYHFGSAGTYTLVVHDDNYTDTGSYSVTLICIGCFYSISPNSVALGGAATNGTLAVTASPGCGWTATPDMSWLTITNGATGSGNGTVSYMVDANPTLNPRTGTMTIAGATFTVNQAGAFNLLTGHDIGNPGPAGSFGYSNGTFSVTGSGEDIEDTLDAFYFVHQPLNGDGQIVARVTSLVGPYDPAAEAGVMIRESLDSGSKHAFLRVDTKTNSVFRRRLETTAYSRETAYAPTNRPWLRLMRMGNTFIAQVSTNGVDWEHVWFTTVSMSNQVQIGMAVTAHHNNSYATATLDNVSIGSLSPLPGAWPLPAPKILLGGENGGMAEFQRVGGFKFLLGGIVGDYFNIKATTNLATPFANWSTFATVTNTYGVLPILDSGALTNQQRYYRLQKVGP